MSPSPDAYHTDALIRRNHELIAAAIKARSEIKETELKSAHIRAEGKAQRTWWQGFREAQRRQPSSA
jgi:hypothetical protein